MPILDLIWDDWNIEHIKKHDVSRSEVEEVYSSTVIKQETHGKKLLLLGKTQKGRLITLVISCRNPSKLYIVSARDMSRKERNIFYDEKQTL